ncbi:MAG TPA: Ycf66 family protein, partial [Nodosilinea sp.]|nr:Ycf66 family protein [Nodosilinea sp.]
MGVHVLAIAVWLGSISLYGAAFFFPEVHRRHDFFWSGVGAFYGLVLWFSAVQTSPTELLGHLASVVLLGWLGWQTLSLRRKRTPLDLQTPLTQDSWPTFGRQLKQSALNLLQSTPVGRWLPKVEEGRLPGDPAIATSEIRASSLKDVDYEFVDELAPAVSAKTVMAEPVAAPEEVVAVPPSASPKPSRPVAPAVPKPPASPPAAKPKGPSLGDRMGGLRAWIGAVVKTKQAPPAQREVIDIPPRPSPLDRKKPKREMIDIPPRPSPLDRKKPKREVIDIPPRPSPLDRKKPKPAEEEASPPETVIIVDTSAVESEPTEAAIASEASSGNDGEAVSPNFSGADATDSSANTTDNLAGNEPESNW